MWAPAGGGGGVDSWRKLSPSCPVLSRPLKGEAAARFSVSATPIPLLKLKKKIDTQKLHAHIYCVLCDSNHKPACNSLTFVSHLLVCDAKAFSGGRFASWELGASLDSIPQSLPPFSAQDFSDTTSPSCGFGSLLRSEPMHAVWSARVWGHDFSLDVRLTFLLMP